MKKHRMVLAVALIAAVCLLAGCSADQLMGTGKTLGQLGNAGTGYGGEKHVADATETVEGFIEKYESLIDWDRWKAEGGSESIVDGKETVQGQMYIKSDEQSRKEYRDLIDRLVQHITAARESRASDESLKAALNTLYKDYDGVKKPYKGVTTEWMSHKGMKQVINVVPIISAIMGMVIPPGSEVIEKVYQYDSPFPVQGTEMCLLVSDVYQLVLTKMTGFLFDFIQFVSKPSTGKPFPVSDLKYMLDNMAASVGDRKDVTVGDKIAMCMIIDIVDMAGNALVKYAESHPGSGAERFDKLNAEWILGACGAELDRIYTELEVVGYIYDTNIDAAAITGIMLGN